MIMNRLADLVYSQRINKYLLFLFCTIIAILISGYHFGVFDQNFHITYLKKIADPSLYPSDPLLEIRNVHFSFFWFPFVYLYRLGILEPALFAIHFIITFFTFWMLWILTNQLFGNPITNVLVTISFVFIHMGMPGFQVFEFCLLNRTFAFPFLLFAIILYLRNRYLSAFFLVGLIYNLHVLSATYILIMFLFDGILRLNDIGMIKYLSNFLLFILGAIPVLVWRTGYSPIDFSLRPDLLSVTTEGILISIYYIFSRYPQVWINTIHGVASFAMLVIAWKKQPSKRYDRIIRNFVLAIVIVLLIQIITTYWLPITIVLQLQLLRMAFYLLIFGYIYFANFLVNEYKTGKMSNSSFLITCACLITFISPLLPLFYYGLQQWFGRIRWRQILFLTTLIVLVGIVCGFGLSTNYWSPGIHIYRPDTPWVDTQLWAKNNSTKDSVFIIPPQLYWHYTPDWRVFSERGTLVTLSDLMEIPFEPTYLPEWKTRMETIAPGAIQSFNGNFFQNTRTIARSFYANSEESFLKSAQDFGASYLVVEKPHSYALPIVYENSSFIIYSLPPSP